MLRTVECSGFKSFDGFKLEFNPGLNVLVGPNGSGKTNLVLFLEFLGYLTNSSLIEAIGKVGGAGSIFRRSADGKLGRQIDIKIRGSGKINNFRKKQRNCVSYDYECTILMPEKENIVVFEKQKIIINISLDESNDKSSELVKLFTESKIDVETKIHDGSIITSVNHLDIDIIEDYFISRNNDGADVANVKKKMDEYLSRIAKSVSLIQYMLNVINGSEILERDLRGTKSFNVSPASVRASEDIVTQPRIQADGRGLAATLYQLQTHGEQDVEYMPIFYHPHFLMTRRPEQADKILNRIKKYAKIVNDEIVDIYVIRDAIENRLIIIMKVRYEGKVIDLPFSLVSDGTAKWFTLITAVLTNSSLFTIEEPENFLHPLMQFQIVRIVREQFAESDDDRFAIITTHSETIINSCDPREIIIFEMLNGKTESRRPVNIEILKEEIERTGFGLAYYYISEGL